MDELAKKLGEQWLTTSQVRTISNASVPKTAKKKTELVWVDVAKRLLKRVGEQDDVTLSHNVRIFIEISVKAEVKDCMSSSAKLNRKRCPQISGLLTYIHCLADTETQPTKSMHELDVSKLTGILLAAVVDLQVTGVRSGDEKNLVAELYTKLTTIFEQSSERLCDCLLQCRCFIYKNYRKPKVLVPLIRRVLLCSGSSHSSIIRCVSGTHYIKLLLLAKIWLFMVDTNEVSGVRSLVAGALKIPAFFKEWLDQNEIPWLRQTDKSTLKVKSILKCMTVSEVLECLYKLSTCIKKENEINDPPLKEEKKVKDLDTSTKKKKKKRALSHEEKIEDTQPKNKKSKKDYSLEAECNISEVENKKLKSKHMESSLPNDTEVITRNDSNEIKINDSNNERKKRKKKKKDKSEEGKLNGINETEVQPDLVNIGATKNKKSKSKEGNMITDICESKLDNANINEDVSMEPINKNLINKDNEKSENEVIGDSLKEKKKKKKKKRLDELTVEDSIDGIGSGEKAEKVENSVNKQIQMGAKEDVQFKQEISSVKKKNKRISSVEKQQNDEDISVKTKPENEVSSVENIMSVTGWNVSPTSQEKTSNKKIGDFTVSPVKICNQNVKQKGSADTSVETPKSISKKNNKKDSTIKNKEQQDLEDTPSSTSLNLSQSRGRSREHLTPTQSRDRSQSLGRRIFTPESSKWSTPNEKQRERKLSGSTPDVQRERRTSLSREEVISHRKRVKRDSLTFTVTDLTEEEMALLKGKDKEIKLPEKNLAVEKVSLGIQTEVSSLNENKYNVKLVKPKAVLPVNSVSEINEDVKVLKPKLSSPGSYKVLKPRVELTKENGNLVEQDIIQKYTALSQSKMDKSQEVLKLDNASNKNVNEESDSDIEVVEEVMIVNSTSKTAKDVDCLPSDETDIDEASGTESDIVPCDENLKMFTDEENRIYHEKLMEEEQKRKDAEMEQVVQKMLKKDEKEVQEQMKNLNETEKDLATTENTSNKKGNKAEIDSNKMLSKLYCNETNMSISKGNEKESVCDAEEVEDNEGIEVVLQTIVSDTGRVESIQGLHEIFTKEGEGETNKENVQPNGNVSDIQIVEERTVSNENDLKVETQSLNDESAVNILEFKENIPEKSKTSDVIIMNNDQEIKPNFKEQTQEPLKMNKDDLENNDQSKNFEKNDLKEVVETDILIKNREKESKLVEDCKTEKEFICDITEDVHKTENKISDIEAEGEMTHSKLSTDNDCARQKENSKNSTDDELTRQKDSKLWVSDQDEAYEASSDASEEQPRTPSHAIRKKMSERKRSATLANTQIASDSDMSPVRRTQRGMRSAEKSKNRKKEIIQSSSAINISTVDESVASMSIMPTINDSSVESIFSSTSIISTDKHTDGSCETVIAGATASVSTNTGETVKQIMKNGDSDTVESIDDSSIVSQEFCDNTSSTLDTDKTVVADTISSDVTEEVMEVENNMKESLLLPCDQVDIDEDEELEVLSTSGVDDDDEHNTTSPRVTRSKKPLSSPCKLVSSPGSSNVTLKTTSGRRRSSQNQGKIMAEAQDKLGNEAVAPHSQRLAAQALHKELIISPDVSDEECELVSPEITVDSQEQVIETSDNSEDDILSAKQSTAKANSAGLRGVSSGRIRSPQKMIPEEQDETQPKLTRSRQRRQSNISISLNSPSGKGEKTSPKSQTRSRSNSLTGVGQKEIISTPTKPGVQSEILSPKLKGRRSISDKSNNSPLGLVSNIETEMKAEVNEEVKQNKRGRPRKSLVASPTKENYIKTGEQLKSPDLFTSPKSRVNALRESSQSPVSKHNRRQNSTSPVTKSSNVIKTNASPKTGARKISSPVLSPRISSRASSSVSPKPSPKTGTRKNSSPLLSPRMSSRASSSVSPKPSPSTPRSRKTSLASATSPNPNPAPSTPRGRKNSNASPLRKNPNASPLSSPSASNTSVYSTALSSLASPSPVKQAKYSGKKSKSKNEEKEEEKAEKVNDRNKEEIEKEIEVKEEKQTTLKRKSLSKMKEEQTKNEKNLQNKAKELKEESAKLNKRKSVSNEKTEEESMDVDKSYEEDKELVINVDNNNSKGKKHKSKLVDDMPLSPSGRSRRSFEVAEIQDEINDILPRRSSRRSEISSIAEVENVIKKNKDKDKQETLKKGSHVLQDSELEEESMEKRPLRSTRKSILLEEDVKPLISSPRTRRKSILLVEDVQPLISSPRTRRSVLLLGDNDEKPKTPRGRRLSESEATQPFSPRRSSRRSIGSGTQSADESNAVQKINVGQRRQSLAPLREEVGNEDKSDTQKRKTRASISTPLYNTKDLRTRGSRTPAATTTPGVKVQTPKGSIDISEGAPMEIGKSIRPRRSIHSSK